MTKYKILYVDDEPINLELFNVIFNNDYEIYTCTSAQEGLQILNNKDISLVISDYKMPEMNGIEFIKRIKEANANIFCILLSAYSQTEMIQNKESIDLLYAYIQKPWEKEILKQLIDKALINFLQ
ncbi:MAG: response regulator [Bacteroidales bacterium]